jgi:hypothetical protein
MGGKNKSNGKLPPFVPIFRHTMKSPAWRALSVGARATFLALKANYNTNAQNAVFLSSRDAAKEFGVHKDTASKWLHELEHYGFVVMIQGAHLGASGVGKAARYRLTDCYYAGQPPTYDFQNWGGVLFDPKKQNPVRKIRTPRPKKPAIRATAEMTQNGNKRPKKPAIRDAAECPKEPAITSFNHSVEDSLVTQGAVVTAKRLRQEGLSWRKVREVLADPMSPLATEWDRLHQTEMAKMAIAEATAA